MKKTILSTTVLLLTLMAMLTAVSAKTRAFATIGTGGVTGVYYPTGGAIAKLVNAQKDTYGIRASVESTGGSVYNINAVISGDLEFGMAQSDRQYQAWKGLAEWENKPQQKLRAVFSLHPEMVTLVAADDSDIVNLEDLKGKRVNIGSHGSGNRGNAIDVLTTAGFDIDRDLHAESLKPAEAPTLLQDGRIDAFFYTVGHPSGAINEATAGKRTVHFVPIRDISSLIEQFPYYAATSIDPAQYPMASNKEAIETIGMLTTLVTSEEVSDEIVYAITKEVFTNLDAFKKLHPALANLTAEGMLEGLSAPLHPGAKQFYLEQGFLSE